MANMISTRLDGVLPEWVHELTHWRALAGTIALGLDAMIQGVWDVTFAAMPGQTAYGPDHGGFPNTDALPLLGRDRRLVRGLLETVESFAKRCRGYRDAWRGAGTAFAILDQVAAVCSSAPAGAPRARIVTAAGTWYTREPGGLFKMHTVAGTGFTYDPRTGATAPLLAPAHPWNWDSAMTPAPRFWLILYAPIPGLILDDEDTYGDPTSWYGDGGVIGMETTLAYLEQVRGVLEEWRCQGVEVPWIIVAFDPVSFDPETPGPFPAAGMPDGWWGEAWRPNPSDPTQMIESRLQTARYVPSKPGTGNVPPLGTV